jgi:hypothetical protein
LWGGPLFFRGYNRDFAGAVYKVMKAGLRLSLDGRHGLPRRTLRSSKSSTTVLKEKIAIQRITICVL